VPKEATSRIAPTTVYMMTLRMMKADMMSSLASCQDTAFSPVSALIRSATWRAIIGSFSRMRISLMRPVCSASTWAVLIRT
jgi:hypothetical protein